MPMLQLQKTEKNKILYSLVIINLKKGLTFFKLKCLLFPYKKVCAKIELNINLRIIFNIKIKQKKRLDESNLFIKKK